MEDWRLSIRGPYEDFESFCWCLEDTRFLTENSHEEKSFHFSSQPRAGLLKWVLYR
jgi:hypothetical protein